MKITLKQLNALIETKVQKILSEQKYGTSHLNNQGVGLGSIIKNKSELKLNQNYCIVDTGLNQWNGDWKYLGIKNGSHKFKSDLQFDDSTMEYTNSELIDAIKDGEFAHCI